MTVRGYIYCLSNPAMPGILKIGHTYHIRDRIKGLSASTSVPTDFVLEGLFETNYPMLCENAVHESLAKYHYGKEFFRVDTTIARKAMLMGACEVGSPKLAIREDIRKQAEKIWNSMAWRFAENVTLPILSEKRDFEKFRSSDGYPIKVGWAIKKLAARHKWFAEFRDYGRICGCEGAFKCFDFLSPAQVVHVWSVTNRLIPFYKLKIILEKSMEIEKQILDSLCRSPLKTLL